MAQFVSVRRVVTDPLQRKFELPYTMIPESETVTINGLEQVKGINYGYITWEGNKVIFNDDVNLLPLDVIQIKFLRE